MTPTDTNEQIDFVVPRQKRMKPAFDAIKAEWAQLEAEQATEAKPAAAPAPGTPVPAALPAPTPKVDPDAGFWTEAGRAVVGGVRDAVQEAANTLDDLGRWYVDNAPYLPQFVKDKAKAVPAAPQLPEVSANESTAGQIGRSVTQFAVGFIGATKFLRVAGFGPAATTAGKVVEGAAKGAATDIAVFDPHQKRVSNMVLDLMGEDPFVGRAVFEFLRADPNDSNMEGRLKNAVEGLGMGLLADGLVYGVKALRANLRASGHADPAEAVLKAAAEDSDKAARNTPALFRPKTVDQAAAEFEKRAAKAVADSPILNAGAAPAKRVPQISAANIAKLTEAAKNGDFASLGKAVADDPDFNFAHIESREQIEDFINATSAVFAKQTDQATHGTQSFAQIEALAERIGTSPASLNELYRGTDNLASRVLAARTMLDAVAEKSVQIAKRIAEGDVSDVAALEFSRMAKLHAAIQLQVKGVQTEIARGLAQYNIKASGANLVLNQTDDLLSQLGGKAAILKFATNVAHMADNPEAFARVVRRSPWARTQSAMFEVFYNGILSGPKTHMVNMASNTAVVVTNVVEKVMQAAIGAVRGNPDAVTRAELGHYVAGIFGGISDALRITKEGRAALAKMAGAVARGDIKGAKAIGRDNIDEFGTAYQAIAKDQPILDASTKVELGTRAHANERAISAAGFGLQDGTLIGNLADTLGALINIPGRALLGADELFKAIHFRAELNGQAYRQALSEGLSGDDLARRMADILSDPDPIVRDEAINAARVGTFTDSLGPRMRGVQQALHNHPVLGFIIPFVRTPANILNYAWERTPVISALSDGVRADLAAGGRRANEALAKWATGGSLLTMGYMLASSGQITGGGEGKGKNQAETLGGWLPYSVKVGDQYVQYNRFDPIGMLLGVAADLHEMQANASADATFGEIAAAGTLAISKNVLSKTWLSTASDLLTAIHEQDIKQVQRVLTNTAMSATLPFSAAVRTVRQEVDPVIRETNGLIDTYRNQIPGLSSSLPARVNVLGEERTFLGSVGPDWLSPFTSSTRKDSPAAQEIARLNLDWKAPPRKIDGIDLTPEQYERWLKLAGNGTKLGGKTFKERVDELVQTERYKSLPEREVKRADQPPGRKEMLLAQLHNDYRAAAKRELIAMDPDLKSKFDKRNADKARAAMGVVNLLPAQ